MNGTLQEVLTGPHALKYGALPKVELPSDDALLSRFAQQILAIIQDKGIYRRDSIPVLANSTLRRLEVLEPQTFRTWVEHWLVCYRRRFDRNGVPYDALHTMTKEQAEGVLKCADFWSGLPEVQTVNPERSVAIDPDTGEITLLEIGYDPKSKTLTFGG